MHFKDLREFIEDERFTDMSLRAENSAALVEILDERFGTKTAHEWDVVFRASETDFIYALVQSIEDLPNDPQVQANNYITNFEHPVLGDVQMCNHPNIYSRTPAGIWKEAPEIGQDTEDILINELGYDWEKIGKLQDAGAIL